MGRSNAIILVLGLGACLALSLILEGALRLSSERRVDPAVVEIEGIYGRQLQGPPVFRVEDTLRGPIGVLQVEPLLQSGSERLALSLGQYLWRCCAEERGLVALVVGCKSGMGRVERFQVNSPRRPGLAIRRLMPNEMPSLPALRRVGTKRASSRVSAPGKRP